MMIIMKKFFYSLFAVTIFFSCAQQSDIENLQMQIDDLKSGQIASINAQITSINGSIVSLVAMDSELKGYITTLQEQKDALEKADEELRKSISELETSLKGDISAAEANIIAQLQSYLDGQISTINTLIVQLQQKDEELQNQISALKTYVDGGIQNTKDWASATFVTLEEYNKTAGIVASLQSQIEAINSQIQQMSVGITQEDLTNAINNLDSSLQTKINQAVSNCNSAIATAKSEITGAYTTAIQQAVASSESSLKSWVNNKLSGYYTIAQADAKLSALQTLLEGNLATQKTYLEGLNTLLKEKLDSTDKALSELIAANEEAIEKNKKAISDNTADIIQLRADLTTARNEITAAYQQAISTAIGNIDGQLRGEIATQVNTLNSRIDDEVAAINTAIETLTGRVTQCEKDIKNIKSTIYSIQLDIEELQEQVAAILARIQSVSYVPKYSDGKAVMTFTNNGTITPGTAEFTFELQPSATAAQIAQVWQTALSMTAVYTITKSAPETDALNIESVSAEGGYLSVIVSGSAMKEAYFKNQCSASVRLKISDGNNERCSEYVEMVPWTTDVISFGDSRFKAYCVENFDTSGDGEITEEEAKAVTSITASMLNITSLVGIEYFCNLESIDVSYNKLETLDLSHSPKLKTIDVSGNKLQTLGLGGLSAIETLDCSNNKLGTLDVSDAQPLVTLNANNNQLGALNISRNKVLKELQCASNNITALDFKNNTALETIVCRRNSISVLDVTKLTGLKMLDCGNNSIVNLYLNNNTALESLYCGSNSLGSLNVVANTSITTLDCSSNSLSALDVTHNTALVSLNCSKNNLTSLDVSRNTSLETITCTGNPALEKLWINNASHAAAMDIYKDDITGIFYNDGGIYIPDANLKAYLLALFDDDEDGEISILESENIQNVNCSGHGVSDLTGLECCTNLKYLNFNGNSVTTVNLPNLPHLETIVAYGNPISKLNVNNDTALTALYLQDVNTNALSGTEMTITAYDQASTLYLAFAGTPYTTLNLNDNDSLTSYDISENTQLTKFYASNNSLVTNVNIAPLTALAYLDLSNCGLTSLNVDTNTALETLNCSHNNLSSLNVDNNTVLVTLDCSDNHISTIRITNNTALETVNVSSNQLSNINVRKNTALKSLNVASNANISALALGYNNALEKLNASNTALSDIDLTANQAITTLDLSGCSSLLLIDVSKYTTLVELNVSNTSLTSLNVSNNAALKKLYVNGCPISSLIITSKCANSLYYQYIVPDGVVGIIFQASTETVKIISIDENCNYWMAGDYSKVGATSSSNGAYNTDQMVSLSTAAQWCRNHGPQWYLPAKEELIKIYSNITSLNNRLLSIGGTQLKSEKYWSSTEDSASYAYYVSLSNGGSESYFKHGAYYIRAIRQI